MARDTLHTAWLWMVLAALATVFLIAGLQGVLATPAASPARSSPVEAHALRLRPGQDLRRSLLAAARERRLRAGCVLSVVGSLRRATLRMADAKGTTVVGGPLEIVALGGTITEDGCHLHLSASDGTGRTWGGHLADGCEVYTTVEVVLGELSALQFRREIDPMTTFHELVIEERR